MKRHSRRALVVGATLAALAVGSPARALDVNNDCFDDVSGDRIRTVACERLQPIPFAGGWPGVGDIVEACHLDNTQNTGGQYSYVTPLPVDSTSSGASVPDAFGTTLTVTILAGGAGFKDDSKASQQSGTPGVDAVVAGNGSSANIYCRVNMEEITGGIVALGGGTPTKLEFYWSRGPCLATDSDNACYAYNGTPNGSLTDPVDPALDPNAQPAHILTEYVIGLNRTNSCGCPFFQVNDDGTLARDQSNHFIVSPRLQRFCDSSLPIIFETINGVDTAVGGHQLWGACPYGQPLTGLSGQSTQTSVQTGSGDLNYLCNRILTTDGTTVYVGPENLSCQLP